MKETAFPNFSDVHDGSCEENPGLSKIDLFSAMAMQGLLSRPTEGEPDWDEYELAKTAIEYARALYVELELI